MKTTRWLDDGPHRFETNNDGTLTLVRHEGAWLLCSEDGSQQASPGLDAVWRVALGAAAVASRAPRASVLVLGVALGGTFRLIRGRWPAARIVAVDWEPALFDLGRALGVHPVGAGDPGTRFVVGDAAEVVPTLEGSFDLVLVDLFRGFDVAAAVRDAALVAAVADRLSPGAVVLVNALHEADALDPWQERLGTPRMVEDVPNLVGLFRA